jgi:hypothetical protein
MKSRVKDHASDDEDEVTQEENKMVPMSQEEIERRKLKDLPVIADSEISPAAYLFQHQEEHDELNLFESE